MLGKKCRDSRASCHYIYNVTLGSRQMMPFSEQMLYSLHNSINEIMILALLQKPSHLRHARICDCPSVMRRMSKCPVFVPERPQTNGADGARWAFWSSILGNPFFSGRSEPPRSGSDPGPPARRGWILRPPFQTVRSWETRSSPLGSQLPQTLAPRSRPAQNTIPSTPSPPLGATI